MDAAFKESAALVMDCCKDAATMFLFRRIWQETGDGKPLCCGIGQIALMAEKDRYELTSAANVVGAVGRLHS